MSKRTRYFVVTAGAILTVGLATGLVASYMGLPVAFTSAAAPNELQYVPAEATLVGYANVREIMDSSFRERFRQFEPDTSERDEFQEKTGVNIEEDINTVVTAIVPEGDSLHRGVLILARGRFEHERLEALGLEHGATVEQYAGKRLLLHPDSGNRGEFGIGFLEADLIALGSIPVIKRAIDANGGRNIVSTNADLMQQIAELEASNAWAVGRFDAIANSAQVPSAIQAHLPAIQWFSAATHINGGVTGVFKAEARDEESAKNMRDVANGFLALARMQASSHPELKTMVDSLQLSGEGRNVAVSFTLPTELFDALEELKKLEQAH